MNTVLLGNIVALIGAAIMVLIGFLKTKKQILTAQCFQYVALSVSNAILGAFTGITANVVGIARNLFCMKKEFTVPWKIAFIAVQLALLLAFNSDGWLGLLPAAATCAYTWFLDRRDEVQLKIVIILTVLCWAVYDFVFKNYVTFAFDLGTAVSNLVGIITLRKAAKRGEAAAFRKNIRRTCVRRNLFICFPWRPGSALLCTGGCRGHSIRPSSP